MKKTLHNKISVTQAINPALYTTTQTGSEIDLAGYSSAVVVFQPGTKTDGTHTPSLTECDTSGGSFTAVSAGNLSAALTALASNTAQTVGYLGTKRFIKAVVTVTGSPATGCVFGATVVRGNPATLS